MDVLEVRARGVTNASLVVLWHPAPGSPAGAPTRLDLQSAFIAGTDEKTFRFELWRQPGWTGRVPGISLHTDASTRGRAEFQCIRFLRRALDPDLLEDTTEAAWRVTLAAEQRLSLVVASSAPVGRRFRVPAGPAILRFGFGASSGAPHPVDLELVSRLGSASPTPLFSRRLEAADRGRWHDVEVNLPVSAGAEVDLEFRVAGPKATPNLVYVSSPLLASPRNRDPSFDVVLVSLDTLRADRLSAYGYTLPTTPRLERFARERAARFTTVVSQAPSTHPSHASLFSGLDAFRHNANRDAAGSDLPLLAEMFRDAGYETAAFTGGAMMHPRHGLAQGFDSFRYWLNTERRDDEIDTGLAQLEAWIRAPRLAPRFLFWHTYEIHSPYREREPYFSRLHPRLEAPTGQVRVRFPRPRLEEGYLAPGPSRFLVHESEERGNHADGAEVDAALASALYDSAIAYADHRVGQLLDELERTGWIDRTIVAVVSDHGESFGEHGLGFHGHLYDDNLLVPLLLAVPGKNFGGRVVTGQVRLMDLMPTLLEAAGLAVPDGLDAASLLPILDGRRTDGRDAWSYASESNRGLSFRRGNGLKYLFNNTAWRVLLAREELYDLRADPNELRPLAHDDSQLRALRAEVRRTLEDRASGWRLTLSNGGEGRLLGRISGAWIHGARVRALGPDATPLEPLENPPSLRFDLPPRSLSTWLLDGAPEGELDLRFDRPGDPRITVAPFDVEDPRSWIFEAGAFRAVDGRLPRSDETGFGLQFAGSGGAARGTPAPAESEEMRQLVALGYLN